MATFKYYLMLALATVRWTVVLSSGKCDEGWEEFESRCYNFMTSPKQTWDEAVRDCTSNGAVLASVKTQREFTHLMHLRSYLNAKVGPSPKGALWQDDNTAVAPYGGAVPSSDAEEKCLIVDSMFWKSQDCSLKEPYMCVRPDPDSASLATTSQPSTGSNCPGENASAPMTIPPKPIAEGTPVCTAGWDGPSIYARVCYLHKKTVANWYNARKSCQDLGAYLASPRNSNQNQFLYYWSDRNLIWLGATDELQEGHWLWHNDFDDPLTWNAWYHDDEHQCPCFGRDRNCLHMMSERRAWAEGVCNANTFQYVCEKPLVACPHMWTDYSVNNLCYGFSRYIETKVNVDKKWTYDEARCACKKVGAHMVDRPKNEVENQWLVENVKWVNGSVWFKQKIVFRNNEWLWKDPGPPVDVYPITWSKWYSKTTEAAYCGKDRENCVYLTTIDYDETGRWFCTDCVFDVSSTPGVHFMCVKAGVFLRAEDSVGKANGASAVMATLITCLCCLLSMILTSLVI